MSTKAEKERQKQIQDKCQTLLTQMLRDEDNKYCVDCDAKGPRWASWNLGIFLCIRCAGIHRNLGVHISKVKSVNLDTWTPEQVVSLQQMGNSRARAVYEANLPDNFRRPQADSALETFVRAKYEAKKYIAREWVPPSLPKVNWDKELDEEAEKLKKKKRESKISSVPVTSSSRKVLENVIPQPLPKPSTSPKPQRTSQPTVTANSDLLGLDTPLQENTPANSAGSTAEDVFTNFLSVSAPQSGQRSAEEDSFFNQPQPQGSAGAGTGPPGKLTKDSILALYSKSQPPPPQQNHVNPFPLQGGFVTGYQTMPFLVNNSQVPTTQPIAVQGSMFPAMSVGMPASTINSASNPFYNMAAAANVQPSPQTLPLSYPPGLRLTQQMGSLNIGAPSNPYQPAIPPPVWQ